MRWRHTSGSGSQLADELGLDPGPRLQQLEQQILGQDASLDVPPARAGAPRSDPPREPAVDVRRARSAATPTSLPCRSARDKRLVEIVGPGGIGKTALAIAIGRELTSSERRRGRRRLVGQARDRGDRRRRRRHVDRGAERPGGEAALFERLKDTAALVILDNCEHVIDAAAGLAVRLLDAAPGYGSCAPARSRWTSTVRPCSSSHRSRSPTPSSCSPVEPTPNACVTDGRVRRRRCSTSAARSTACRWRSSSPRPGPRRCRSTTSPGGWTIASRAERPDQPTAGTPPITQVDHPVELRAAVPR